MKPIPFIRLGQGSHARDIHADEMPSVWRALVETIIVGAGIALTMLLS